MAKYVGLMVHIASISFSSSMGKKIFGLSRVGQELCE